MTRTHEAIAALVTKGAVHVSDHAFEEMRKDDIFSADLIDGFANAKVVEDYPDANRGPSVLVYITDRDGRPLHAVWGVPKRRPDIAVLITAYRPDQKTWTNDYLKRLKP